MNQQAEDAVMPARLVRGQADLMLVAPIPTYLVNDGLEDGLYAAEVYVHNCQHKSEMCTHALPCLRKCMVRIWWNGDANHSAGHA